jgi:hypothetical protein
LTGVEADSDPRQDPDPALEAARVLLIDGRTELSRIDTKASILLASAGIVGGSVINALLAEDWLPFEIHNGAEWLWWLGALLTSDRSRPSGLGGISLRWVPPAK